MSFEVREHTIDAQHIRELPNALAIDETSPDATLQLHVKQYTPRNNPNPKPGDLTIIAFHGNGFCKEVYEPIWEQLLASLPSDRRIRGIWIAETTHQGTSYLVNESKLGPGVAWDDHARDILQMVNHFRNEMPPPLLGVGHSMGSLKMVKLATLHPRLFHAITLLDPWFWSTANTPPLPPTASLRKHVLRQDLFENAEAAKQSMRTKPGFNKWDPRCLQIHLDYLFRATPTVLYPETSSDSAPWTLRTPKQMEVYSTNQPNLRSLNTSSGSTRLERLALPHVNYASPIKAPIHNPGPKNGVSHLPGLRPRCLFLYGTKSEVNQNAKYAEVDRKRNLEITGRDSGGSGGAELGCVSEDWIEGSHLFPFESPTQLGERLGRWCGDEGIIWETERKALQELLWSGRNEVKERQDFEPGYYETIKNWDGLGWVEPEGEATDEGIVKAKL